MTRNLAESTSPFSDRAFKDEFDEVAELAELADHLFKTQNRNQFEELKLDEGSLEADGELDLEELGKDPFDWKERVQAWLNGDWGAASKEYIDKTRKIFVKVYKNGKWEGRSVWALTDWELSGEVIGKEEGKEGVPVSGVKRGRMEDDNGKGAEIWKNIRVLSYRLKGEKRMRMVEEGVKDVRW